MTRYAVRRLALALPLLIGVLTLVFLVVTLAPGDPASLLVGPGLSSEAIAQLRSNFGLDQPLPVRYAKWLLAFLSGDLGISFSQGRPVLDVLLQALPDTLLLTGLALAASFALGIVGGVVQAMRQDRPVDHWLTAVGLFFYSMPAFWLGTMMILVFAVLANAWDWPIQFPASGTRSVGYDGLGLGGRLVDRLQHLVLPVGTLTLILAAGVARYTRGSMLEVVRQDFVRTARAMGLSERAVIFKHALRNALLPVVTLLGLYLPLLLSGAVFVEVVFAWPGMGKLLVDAVGSRDYPLVMAASSLLATMVVVGNLVADLLYAALDPRVRHD